MFFNSIFEYIARLFSLDALRPVGMSRMATAVVVLCVLGIFTGTYTATGQTAIKRVDLIGTNTATGTSAILPAAPDNPRWQTSFQQVWRNSGTTEENLNGAHGYIYFERINGFYAPTTWEGSWDSITLVRYYEQWTNFFSVDVTPNDAVWTISGVPDYADFNLTTRTGTWSNVRCPTGTYTVAYHMLQDHYAPTNSPQTNEITGVSTGQFASTYLPFTNSIEVDIVGIVTDHDVAWRITAYPSDFTNSSAYRGTVSYYTNDYTVTPIPVGSYTLRFPTLPGYDLPVPQLTNVVVSGAFNPAVTAVYARQTGTIRIVPQLADGSILTNAPWSIDAFPADYANLHAGDPINYPMSGTGLRVITNAPVGEYSIYFGEIEFYGTPTPNPVVQTSLANSTRSYTATYSFTGRLLTLNVTQPGDVSLAGVGAGSIRRDPEGVPHPTIPNAYYYQDNVAVELTAVPTNMVVVTGNGNISCPSFFFEWTGRRWTGNDWSDDLGGNNVPSLINPITLIMNANRQVTVLFSRANEESPWDNAGDLDGDGLPDEWERRWGLDPMSPDGDDGTYGNPDNPGDWIPSVRIVPPMEVVVQENAQQPEGNIAGGVHWTFYNGVGGALPGYPLQRIRMLTPQVLGVGGRDSPVNVGYAGGVPFYNFLECRGFDGFYGTNGGYFEAIAPDGWMPETVPNDDPGTDPLDFDTQDDDVSDGWKYYFWYWRSAEAYNRGLTNSMNLDWVTISPARALDKELDSDGDGLSDYDEYINGTDPTHADTDGDGMDDWWEIDHGLNPLDYYDSLGNDDADYMAVRRDMGVLDMTNGITNVVSGTLFTNDIVYVGNILNPDAAWIDVAGNTNFNLYVDVVLLGGSSISNGQPGTVVQGPLSVYYGMASGLSAYQKGYPVWVDMNSNGIYDDGVDAAWVNPRIKHELVYMSPPPEPGPAVSMFSPLTAWFEGPLSAGYTLTNDGSTFTYTIIWDGPENTERYNNYQEYLGGNYHGRVAWDAAGRVVVENDNLLFPERNSATNPNAEDTDDDGIPDGWELYVGMNPHYAGDAQLDPDEVGFSLEGVAGLVNREEWANTSHPLSRELVADWPTKIWPTDPGVIIAPPPNDPHPHDTDFDGVPDHLERTHGSSPVLVDTDRDGLPDGWEIYGGSNPLWQDANDDTDGDGLLNWQEYWTGTVPEWQYCNPSWEYFRFIRRRIMRWDSGWGGEAVFFLPPDFMSCPSFLYENNVIADLNLLREDFSAMDSLDYRHYNTTLANNPDSDEDGMDDFWEVFHCLNPLVGYVSLIDAARANDGPTMPLVASVDADPNQPGYQVGLQGQPFNSLIDLIDYFKTLRSIPLPAPRVNALRAVVGPHYFGLVGNDPDGDGIPNFEEYTYYRQSHLHTAPSPLWRTDPYTFGPYAFISRNYTRDSTPIASGWNTFGFEGIGYSAGRGSVPFRWAAMTEGYDTDNNMLGDYYEVTGYRDDGTVAGTDPLDDQSPLRNRVMWLDGTNSWGRSYAWSHYGDFSKFSVEAWVRPARLQSTHDQVIVEKSSRYSIPTPLGPATVSLANFQLGISADGVPYVLFHGISSWASQRASASQLGGQLRLNEWIHLAGVFDGSRLILYVNGVASAIHRTTDVPARGIQGNYGVWHPNCNLSVGARELQPGWHFPGMAEKFFAGYIDEVRVWDRILGHDEILARKNRRLSADEIGLVLPGNSPYVMGADRLFSYYNFNDLADPEIEGIAPPGYPAESRPPLSHNYSQVYTNNYLVIAADRVRRIPRLPPLDTRVIGSNSVASGSSPDAYGISATNYLDIVLPDDFRNSANPYNFTHSGFNIDMGRGMWMVGRAQGKKPPDTWLDTIDDGDADSIDSDGDGLPDWWEIMYGLDPNDATGDNGAWGDPDGDGLPNWAEYMAGTSPVNWDTAADGLSDYASRSGTDPYSLTWGELFTPGDGIPALWKVQHGLDPRQYVGHLDPDGDGWSTYAEFLASTHPNNSGNFPNPRVSGSIIYTGRQEGTLRVVGYQQDSMDGPVKASQIGLDYTVSEVVGYADGTRSFTGRLPYAPVSQGTSVRISAILYWWQPGGVITYSYATFTFTGPETFTYSGMGQGVDAGAAGRLDYNTGEFSLTWGNDEVPSTGNEISVSYSYVDPRNPRFSFTGFGEGPVYLAGYLDVNDNEQWDPGEPFGVAHGQPFHLSVSDLSGIRIYLHDELPGYPRFTWSPETARTNQPTMVHINRTGTGGSPDSFDVYIRPPRNFMHEWDYQRSGKYGLQKGNYRWWAGEESGTFSVNWELPKRPVIVAPRGDTLYLARNRFSWTMCTNATMYRLQVARKNSNGSLTFVEDNYYPAPGHDRDGVYRDYFPKYAADWGNGVYYWRIAGWNPLGQGPWSGDDLTSVQTFTIKLDHDYSRTIKGNIYYFGKVTATNIIVEAFDNFAFSGEPVARVHLRPAFTRDSNKVFPYTINGLSIGQYYIRAFIDTVPANGGQPSGQYEFWSTRGFVRDPFNLYVPGPVNLAATTKVEGQTIILRDHDTDGDQMPDAWEIEYFGNLNQTGDMDYDGDGLTNLEKYLYAGGLLDPTHWDSDGDGLSDYFELNYCGSRFGFLPRTRRRSLNPADRDTDRDGYSDGAELRRYNTDPLDPNSYPIYRPRSFGPSPAPGDFDGDGRTDPALFDSLSGTWYSYLMSGYTGSTLFGGTGVVPLLGDFSGDGHSDMALYHPASGYWHVRTVRGLGGSMQFGDANMIPVPADYTGDMRTDFGLFDRVTATWHFKALDGRYYSVRYGAPTHIPVPGDYDGDMRANMAVYDKATGMWSVRTWRGNDYSLQLGGPNWVPVPGDYDGDGRFDPAVFNAVTGDWKINTATGRLMEGRFGWYGVIPVPGDYDGDGLLDPAFYDPPSGMWYVYLMGSGRTIHGQFGWAGAYPVLGVR